MTHERVTLELSHDEALVLFDWLSRFNLANSSNPNAFEDQAEQRVLWDIEAMLEAVLVEPVSSTYLAAVAAARSRVRDAT